MIDDHNADYADHYNDCDDNEEAEKSLFQKFNMVMMRFLIDFKSGKN